MINFENFFENQTLRLDFSHSGHAQEEQYKIENLYLYSVWGRNTKQLCSPFDRGAYSFNAYDLASKALIFSKGYDCYFHEYQHSKLGEKCISRDFHESILLPKPKKPFKFSIEKRQANGQMSSIFSAELDPSSSQAFKPGKVDSSIKILNSLVSGSPESCLDIAVVAEGYTQSEYSKFEADLKLLTDTLFQTEPYKSLRQLFNVSGIFKASLDSGVSEPSLGKIRQTVLKANFDALGIERYLVPEDNKALYDILSPLPFDSLVILANSERFGGGGIYNSFSILTPHQDYFRYLLTHEIGHSLTGLGDEYYGRAVTFSEIYTVEIEPANPNITAQQNLAHLKWERLRTKDTEVPTKWEKLEFENLLAQWEEFRNTNKMNTPEFQSQEKVWVTRIQEFLDKSKWKGAVGAFEGAGYKAKGLFRPSVDCIMFSRTCPNYCAVCEQAIREMIAFYTN